MPFFDLLIPIIEIAVMAVVVNYLLYFFKKSSGLISSLVAFFSIFMISSWFGFPVLSMILTHCMSIAAVGLIIIFQPELRAAMSKLSLRGKMYQEASEFDKFLDQLTRSAYLLAERREGALIALQNGDDLSDFAQKGVMLNAHFSSELLETIFASSTPLHDGAVIIADDTIVAASVILPLASDATLLARLGTRHRAALGFSQETDALVIAISEESGKVSLAREGKISHDVKPDKFQGVIQSLYEKEEQLHSKRKFHRLREWIRGT